MATYMTKQRKLLLNFLHERPDEIFSAQDLAISLKENGISQSSIYRNLLDLEQEGKVRRIIKNGTNEIYYQYLDNGVCSGKIHLCCVKCLHTFHMNTVETNTLADEISKQNGFSVDKSATVIYGVCKECSKNLSIGD